MCCYNTHPFSNYSIIMNFRWRLNNKRLIHNIVVYRVNRGNRKQLWISPNLTHNLSSGTKNLYYFKLYTDYLLLSEIILRGNSNLISLYNSKLISLFKPIGTCFELPFIFPITPIFGGNWEYEFRMNTASLKLLEIEELLSFTIIYGKLVVFPLS